MFENIKITDVLYSDKINEIKAFKPRNRDEYLKLLNAHFNLKIVPDFPIKVSLETSSLCNYNCPMCPREHMTRPKQNMPFDMAKKAIDQCKRNGVYY